MRMNSQDVRIEFLIEKCYLITMKSGKIQITEGIELLNPDRFRMLGEKISDKYLLV